MLVYLDRVSNSKNIIDLLNWLVVHEHTAFRQVVEKLLTFGQIYSNIIKYKYS